MNAPTQAGAPAQPRNHYEVLKAQLERSKAGFFPLLGHSKTNVETFVTVVLQAATDNPELLEADRRSFIAACMKAAKEGMAPDGNESVLNIYNCKVKDKQSGREHWVKMVQYLPMVGGMVKALYEHPDVEMIDAAAVYEKDHFKFVRGDNPRLEHEPTGVENPGEIIAAYLVVRLRNGQIKREVMWRRDIEKVRAAGKNSDNANSPWKKWYDQQAIKSVIKRGRKQLPRANKFTQVEASDNEALGFTGTPGSVADIAARNSMPALEHIPGDYLETNITNSSLEVVEVVGGDEEGPGGGDGGGQQQQRQAEGKPELSAEEFSKKAPGWKKAIADGKAPNEVIATAETRNTLTMDQKVEIASWAVKPTPSEGAES